MILYRLNLVLFLVICLVFSCSQEKKIELPPPDYAKPGYTNLGSNSITTSLRFTDITAASGIDFVHQNGAFGKKWMPETTGSGGGFLDYDQDGLPDLFIVNSSYWPGHAQSQTRPTPKLYRNLGKGKFEDVTEEARLDIVLYGMGCAFADYDSDGDTDIYLTAVGDNKLFRNDGGKFQDVTRAMKVAGNSDEPGRPSAWSTSAAWVDVDRDGWLDLFVCNYVIWTPETDLFTTLDGKTKSYATPQQYQGETCRLYRNLKGRGFENITEKAGVFNPEGKSLGVAIADFNEDGWPDIVVANDTQPNFLYMNKGDGTFTDMGLMAGIGYDEFGRARAGMGIDVADVSNTGRLSIAIGNFAREPISLFTQINDGVFQDLAGRARLNSASLLRLTFGVLLQDFDLDGYADLFAANGHIEPEINNVQKDITFEQTPQLFLNDGKGRFTDVTAYVGDACQQPIVARGLATADIDDDGDLDLFITVNAGPPKLLRNDQPAERSNWIKFRLRGKSPNLDAVGAAVSVWSGDLQQTRLVRSGSSFLSQSFCDELVFGLGPSGKVDSIEVRWPTDGAVTRLVDAPAGSTYLISEVAAGLQRK